MNKRQEKLLLANVFYPLKEIYQGKCSIYFVAHVYIKEQGCHWFIKMFKFENSREYSSGGQEVT